MGPRDRKPRQPDGQQRVLNLFKVQTSFDIAAFREFIQSQGIRVVHYRAVPDPTGKTARGDNRAVDSQGRRSSDGFIYEEAGIMQVLFYSNSEQESFVKEGAIEYSTAYMTLPDFYEDRPDCPVLVMPWDRFFLKDIEIRVAGRQEVESSVTGLDRLNFPATCVEHLRDANGVTYREKEHFEITPDGDIRWLGQVRPGWNPEQQRGTVYSVRYRYTPFFVCSRLLHEIRVSQVTNMSTYERTVERAPYQIEVVRENVFHDRNNADSAVRPKDDPRFQGAPPSGGMLGPTG
jgi:hypothetical protein